MCQIITQTFLFLWFKSSFRYKIIIGHVKPLLKRFHFFPVIASAAAKWICRALLCFPFSAWSTVLFPMRPASTARSFSPASANFLPRKIQIWWKSAWNSLLQYWIVFIVCVLTLLDHNAIDIMHNQVELRLQVIITVVENKHHKGTWLHNSGHKRSK